jgi:hypothetical protein
MEVRGVCHRQKEALASAEERQNPVLRQELVIDETDDLDIESDRIEVEQRHAEFGGSRDRDVARVGGSRRDELRDDARLALSGDVDRFQHGGLFDHPVLDQPLGKAT